MSDAAHANASWAPMLVIALAQLLLIFNITTLKVSLDPIADDLGSGSKAVKSAIVAYFVIVAGFIMLGTRMTQRFGARAVFRGGAAVLGAALALMAFCRTTPEMLVAQMLAAIATAALVPTLIAMISDHYRGPQQAKALGWLGGLQALEIVPAFLIAGYLAHAVEWRLTYGLLALLAIALYVASGRLCSAGRRFDTRIDTVGVLLTASAMLLIGIGIDRIPDWGLWQARAAAPFSAFGFSPAPLVIAAGAVLLYAFLAWSRSCRVSGRTPLVAPEVVYTARERFTLLSIFVIGAIGAGLTFLIPLYIEVVQGRTTVYTAAALLPFTLAGFAAALLVVRMRTRVSPRLIARGAFIIVAIGVALLGAAIRNDWSSTLVIASLIVAGIGDGALGALLFKLLAFSVPKNFAGDVTSVCGSTNFLGAGVGTALAGALLVGVLGMSVQRHAAANPVIFEQLRAQIDLDSVAFVSNDRLVQALARTETPPELVDEAVRINTEARLDALKISLYVLAGIALLAFVPAAQVPELLSADSAEDNGIVDGARRGELGPPVRDDLAHLGAEEEQLTHDVHPQHER